MSGFFGESKEEREDREFNAGDRDPRNPAEEQADRDYEQQVGSDEHQAEVAEAREGAGFDDPPTEEK